MTKAITSPTSQNLHMINKMILKMRKCSFLTKDHKNLCSKGLTLSQRTNFRLFQTEFADDNFKLNENGRSFSRWVENTVENGEIAH